jgi:hypothetical protein
MTDTTPQMDDRDDEIDLGADPSIDRENLAQALKDFEVANRRVIDLTQRLTSVHRDLLEARSETQFMRIELQRTRAELDQVRADLVGLQSSNSFRVARALAHARSLLRR